MTRQRYSKKEALLRILRIFQGNDPASDAPNTVQGELLSENEILSDIAELLASSLPSETLALPTSVTSAITTSGFASGTASSLIIVSGTAQAVVGATTLVFESGINVEVTGTSVFINIV